jgi:hypothetical protein
MTQKRLVIIIRSEHDATANTTTALTTAPTEKVSQEKGKRSLCEFRVCETRPLNTPHTSCDTSCDTCTSPSLTCHTVKLNEKIESYKLVEYVTAKRIGLDSLIKGMRWVVSR